MIQAGYHQQIFAALIPTLEAPEARYVKHDLHINHPSIDAHGLSLSDFSVHSHAAAALINFCEGSGSTIIILYLDAIVERLLKLLNPPAESGKQPKRYVQEQVITSLAMVADVSEKGFTKVRVDELFPHTFVLIWNPFHQHYAAIMPLLLSVLQNAKGSEYHKLRLKAMECAGLVGEFHLFPSSTFHPHLFDQQLPLAEIFSEKIPASCANSSCKFKVRVMSSR